MGRHDEARAGLEQVRDLFERSRNPVGSAVVSLELAAMDLEAGRTAEVKALAKEMAWILSTEGIEREALEALRLFCEAAAQEKATLAQVQQLLARLERPGGERWPGRR
jgi:hypothetical protein